MLDKWFIDDVKSGLKNSNRFVIIDEQNKSGLLLDILKRKRLGAVFEVSSELDELRSKYDIEKNYPDTNTLIFTTIPLGTLKFLREYCETAGCLRITHLHRYIAQKVNDEMKFDLGSLPPDDIIAMGKLSIGKKKDYWDRIKAGGEEGLFTAEDILEFLNNPEKIFKKYGKEEQRLFSDLMSRYTLYPLENKPPQTIADDISTAIFDHIIYKTDKPFLEKSYNGWMDSKKYESSLKKYASQYTLPGDTDIWNVPTNHPFEEIDIKWLGQIIENIGDAEWVKDKLPIIKERSSRAITETLDVTFLEDIHVLFSYDPSGIAGINNLDDAIEHYQNRFYKLDNAIRHLYNKFLADESKLKPIQEYYQQIISLYLDKWFSFFSDQYKENQTGLLKRIISDNDPPVAIIVGDAISYGVSQEIIEDMGSGYKIQNNLICGNYPSETENNMSSLFVSSGDLYETRDKRQKELTKDTGKNIEFIDVDKLSVAHTLNDYTVLYAPDVDELSEKQNQGALKYYDEFIGGIRDKIDTLFGCGYKKVFLVSDHGFVLTGILQESDKIPLNVPDGAKHERYCVSGSKIPEVTEDIIEVKKIYGKYGYVYFSRTLNPYKTKGAYGFSHGGITPQELLIPYLMIEKSGAEMNQLEVSIINKKALEAVVGDLYEIKIKTGAHMGEVFSSQRKIIIIFVKDRKEFNQSDIIDMKANEEVIKEFSFGKYDEFEAVIVDAESKSRLDSCKIRKQIARDLGGLGGNNR